MGQKFLEQSLLRSESSTDQKFLEPLLPGNKSSTGTKVLLVDPFAPGNEKFVIPRKYTVVQKNTLFDFLQTMTNV